MLALVGTAAVVAQPQAYQMAPAAGVRVIDEGSAAVAQHPVVDELDLPGLEVEIDREAVFLEDVEHCRNGGLAVAVDWLTPQDVSAADLVGADPRLQLPGVLEYRRRKNRALARPKFALPVKPEIPVESLQTVRMALPHGIADGMEADARSVPAALRLTQAEQTDIVGRRVVIGVVVVKADLDVGLVRADTRSGKGPLPGVEHVVDHRAVELLRYRTRHHARQQPIDGRGLGCVHFGHRQAVDYREPPALVEHFADPRHLPPTRRHRKITRSAQDRRQRTRPVLFGCPAYLVETGGREIDPVLLGADVAARPDARPLDRHFDLRHFNQPCLWIGSIQRTSSGRSTGSMSRLTTTASLSLRTNTHSSVSSVDALISWCGT